MGPPAHLSRGRPLFAEALNTPGVDELVHLFGLIRDLRVALAAMNDLDAELVRQVVELSGLCVVRDFLRTESGLNDIPGAEYISARYRRFKRELPEIARVAHLNPAKLAYVDYCETIKRWLDLNAGS